MFPQMNRSTHSDNDTRVGDDMESMETYKKITALSYPILIEMGFQMLVNNLNVFMISHVGTQVVAAVGTATRIPALASILLGTIGLGAPVMIAQYYGAGDYAKTKTLTVEAYRIQFLLALVFGLFMFFFPSVVMHIMHVPQSIWATTRFYLRYLSLLLPFTAFNMIAAGILRSLGSTKPALYFSIWFVTVTTIGNALLIYGWFGLPKLGITGLLISNVFGTMTQFLALFIYQYRRFLSPVKISTLVKEWSDTMRIVRVGIPSAADSGSYQLTQFIIMSMIAILGTDAISTRVYSTGIESVSFLAGLGIAQGVAILVGQEVGRHNYAEARNISIRGVLLGVGFMVVTGTLLFVFGKNIIEIFTHDSTVVTWSATVLKIIAFAQPAKALNMIIGGTLRGSGDNKWLMWNSGLFVWLSVVFAYLLGFAFGFGLYGIWWAMVLDEWVRAALLLRRFYSNRWQGKSYVKRNIA